MLKGKEIILGITGSIACYKAVTLASELRKRNANVSVIMTKEAAEFVMPLTFQVISQNQVYTDMFLYTEDYDIKHISLARKADLIIIAPATANMITKFAYGLADDPLSSTVLASRAPVMVAPAMNEGMYKNPAIQENIEKLKKRGFIFIGPANGRLACGEEGEGRMSEPEEIVKAIIEKIGVKQDLKGKRILVTAGPTREFIDPVRYISNPSSGKMGFAVAEEAMARGADVVLVAGPTSLEVPDGIDYFQVTSAQEMENKVAEVFKNTDAVIMSAAVSDWKPIKVSGRKSKKNEILSIELENTKDIIAMLGKRKGDKVLVGFALESEDVVENAGKKLKEKNLDLIIANRVNGKYPFGSDTNKVTIILKNGKSKVLPELPKSEIANKILDEVVKLLKSSG